MAREKIKAIVKPYLRGPGCKEDCPACEDEAGSLADKILQAIKEAGYVCIKPETEGMHTCPEERVKEGLKTFSKNVIEDEKGRRKPTKIPPFLIT